MSTHDDYEKHVGFRDILLDNLREAVQDVVNSHTNNPRTVFDETNEYCILATICVERCITFGLKRSGLFTTRDLFELLRNGSQASKDANIQGDFLHVNNLLLSKMGKARAWIRWSINQKHLASSLYALASNRPFIKSWFEDYAIMPTVVVNDLHQEIEKLESLPFFFNLKDSQLDNTEIYGSDPNVYRSLHRLARVELPSREIATPPQDLSLEASKTELSRDSQHIDRTQRPPSPPAPTHPPPQPAEEPDPQPPSPPLEDEDETTATSNSLEEEVRTPTSKRKKKGGGRKKKDKRRKSARKITLENDDEEDLQSSLHTSPESDEARQDQKERRKPDKKRRPGKKGRSPKVDEEGVVEAREESRRTTRSSSAEYLDTNADEVKLNDEHEDPDNAFRRVRAHSTPAIAIMNQQRQARHGMVPFSRQIPRSATQPIVRGHNVPPLKLPDLGDRSGPLDTPSILRPVSPSEGHWRCHLEKRQNQNGVDDPTNGVLSFDHPGNEFDNPDQFAQEDEEFENNLENLPVDYAKLGLEDLNDLDNAPPPPTDDLHSQHVNSILSDVTREGEMSAFSPRLVNIAENEEGEDEFAEEPKQSPNEHMKLPPVAREDDPLQQSDGIQPTDITSFMRFSYISTSKQSEKRAQERLLREQALLRGEHQDVDMSNGQNLVPSTGLILSHPNISEADMFGLQGGECFGCGNPMVSLETAYLCHYAFKLYCTDCIGFDESSSLAVDGTHTSTSSSNSDDSRFKYTCSIPARVLDSLDFHLYAVSKAAHEHLSNMYFVPAIPLSQCSPAIAGTRVIRDVGRKLDALAEIKTFVDQCPHSRMLKNILGTRQYMLSSFVTDRDLFEATADPSLPSLSSKSSKRSGKSSSKKRRKTSHQSDNVFGMVSMNDMLSIMQDDLLSILDENIRKYVHHIQHDCSTCQPRAARGESKLWRKLDRCGIQV